MAEQAPRVEGAALDVAGFLKGLKFTRFHVWILVLSCLVTFFDGLDFSLASFTLPYMREEMQLDDAMLGYVVAAAFLGQMIGSLCGSYIADLIGRRPVILWCTVLSAVLTFFTGFAPNPEMVILLRFLGGLSIGGLLAPAWSLNIESMPDGMKATSVTIIMLGFSVGGAVAGQVTNFVAPKFGWEGVFFVSGLATGVLAAILQFTLPESTRWMVAKNKPRVSIIPMLSRFDPAADFDRYHTFNLSDERKVEPRNKSGSAFRRAIGNLNETVKELFKGSLAIITPVIWFTYFCSSFAIYLKSSFGVMFMEALHIERATAANLASIGGLIGAVGGVVLLKYTEKRGPIWIALAPLLGVPLALLIGSGMIDRGAFFIPALLIGSITIGVGHAAVISMTSVYYPTAIRSTGGGWASFMAKFAAVAAPIVGSRMFLADRQAVLDGYNATALCLVGVVIGIIALAFFARRLQQERALADEAAESEPEPAIA